MSSIVLLLPVMILLAITSHLSVVETQTKSKFKIWKHKIELTLSLMDLDKHLLKNKMVDHTGEILVLLEPIKLVERKSPSIVYHEISISDTIHGSVPN